MKTKLENQKNRYIPRYENNIKDFLIFFINDFTVRFSTRI